MNNGAAGAWQRLPTRESPSSDHFSVVNLGIPGYNTTQVLKRLPARARRHQPAMVLVWAGINDAWNMTEVATQNSSWWIRFDGWATRSR